jgi:hypothetical protein
LGFPKSRFPCFVFSVLGFPAPGFAVWGFARCIFCWHDKQGFRNQISRIVVLPENPDLPNPCFAKPWFSWLKVLANLAFDKIWFFQIGVLQNPAFPKPRFYA